MVKKDELLNLGVPRNYSIGENGCANIRTLKLAVPVCPKCQAPGVVSPGWFDRCTHDPYFTWSDATIPGEEVYEDVEGQPGLKKLVSRGEDQPVKRRAPNLRQLPISSRHMTGGGMAVLEVRWANKGFKRPEAIGVAPFCEMKDCWSQSNVKPYKSGSFCCEDHAVLIGADQKSKFLEVLNDEKRAKQLADIAV